MNFIYNFNSNFLIFLNNKLFKVIRYDKPLYLVDIFLSQSLNIVNYLLVYTIKEIYVNFNKIFRFIKDKGNTNNTKV